MEHFEEKIDWTKQFPDFHHVLTSSKKHWVELSHLLPRCRGKRSERKHNFELNSIFFNLAEWFLVELRTAIYVSRRTFLANSFETSVFCFDSRTLSIKFVKLFPKCFGNIYRTDILVSRRTNWEDNCFMENADFSYQVRTLSYNLIYLLAKVILASLSKMNFTRPEVLFEENSFLRTFTKVTCFWVWAENNWQDGQTAFTCPVEQCWKIEPLGENQSFFVIPTCYVKLFRNFKRNWQACQVSIHHLQWHILRKK